MQQNYQTSSFPTVASQTPSGLGVSWQNPNRIKVDDGSSATLAFVSGGDEGAIIQGSAFAVTLPPGAIIDEIDVLIRGQNIGCYGTVDLNVAGSTPRNMASLNETYVFKDEEVANANLSTLAVIVDANDISGGDGTAQIDFMRITVFWHIEMQVPAADVPTRVSYKAFSRDGTFLGELPNVTSTFAFSQDMNSAGASIQIACGKFIDEGVTTDPLLTEDDEVILTEDDLPILATSTTHIIALGNSPDRALYKNSNRIVVVVYDRWHPNGKAMFMGQVNRVNFSYGNGDGSVKLTVLSDGADMVNFIARGYPFAYTNDVVQTSENGYVTVIGYTEDSWDRYGQTFTTGSGTTNVGAIQLLLQGSAMVTVSLYDGPNGTFLGSVTKDIASGSPTVEQFNFPQLLTVPSSTSRFFTISVGYDQVINVYRHSTSGTYSGGSMYEATYSGGSSGGTYSSMSGDLYFVTKKGTPTTTTIYSDQDPTTGMMHGILADYNTRGGRIKERNFQATGLSLTYPFNMATIFDAHKKILELAPTGFYSYVDLGTAEMDILQQSESADFTVVFGRDIQELDMSLSIEQVKNYLLFTGGPIAGVNLFKEYPDPESAALYGPRYTPKTDNRVILEDTANAIGESFIEENSAETQETTLVILNSAMDITKLLPGKTVGFRNSGNFIDDMILPIVRREYSVHATRLTLGRLPIRMNDEVQRISRDLFNEQTANNPSQPS